MIRIYDPSSIPLGLLHRAAFQHFQAPICELMAIFTTMINKTKQKTENRKQG
jgi:hypothetical protein